tara:strand:- start:16270 stop:18771 length:2502 start_codon:yes stop_codon:yes gene_type:complete
MSRTAHKLMASSGGKGYEIEQSLMFNAADTAHLKRTPSSAGNRRTFTLSAWIKTTDALASSPIFCCGTGTNDASTTYISFYQGKMQWQGYNTNYRVTNRVFRDVGSWYHFVWAVDTTIADGSADNRIRLYVNGVEETSFGTKNNPAQNYDFIINSTNEHQLGDEGGQTGGYPPFAGYMAEVNFIDGAQLTPSSFGETDSATGQWIPKEITGLTYGTNGFYLKFVSGAIGTDSSGQSNNYTATNLADADVLLDTPSNNYPIINSVLPLDTTLVKLYEGNLRTYGGAQSGGNGQANSFCTFQVPSSGKWYIESYVGIGAGSAGGNIAALGVMEQDFIIPNTDAIMFSQSSFTGMVFSTYQDFAKLYDGGSAVATVTGLTGTVYVVALAIDVDNGKVYTGYDGGSSITWLNSGNPGGNSNGTAHTFSTDTVIAVHLSVDGGSPANTADLRLNFGQNGTFNGGKTAGGNSDSAGEGNFFYSVPSGFKALCSKNLPTPAVKKSTEHFNTVLWTGDGTDNRSITGVGFQPDLTWIKPRSEAQWHNLYDAIRGANKAIYPNSNYVEETLAETFESFAADGFTVSYRSQSPVTNKDTITYVAWNWKAGGSGSSNTDGSINTISTSVNTTAGISISTYTGTGSNATIGHGLGAAPKLIWAKNTDTNDNWRIYFGDNTDYMAFNWDGGSTDDNTSWNDTSPTSSVFSIGTDTNTNRSGDVFVAYCFAEVKGFSKFGTYEANNSTNGPFIYTGFTPSWIMFKYVDGAGESWWMLDSTRDPYGNLVTEALYANLTGAESGIGGSGGIDILSNGFKIRATNGGINSANTYFYMAFAEFPFKYANAI